MDQVAKLLESIKNLYLLNRLDEAIYFCDELLKHDNDNYEVLLQKALCLVKKDEAPEAKKMLQKLAKKAPKDARPAMGLAYMYQGEGEIKAANQQFFKVLRVSPENEDARFHHALTLERLNKLKEAEESIETGFKEIGETPGLLYIAAVVQRRQKNHDKAVEYLEKISDGIEAEYVANKHFELMQSYNALKRYDEAFDALVIAQQKRDEFLTRQGVRADKQDYLNLVRLYQSYLDSVKPEDIRQISQDHDKEICFFVGFPRSGTTLAQQMLQAHPEVEAMEERRFISDMCEKFLSENQMSFSGLNSLSEEKVKAFRNEYFARVKEYIGHDKYALLVDKMPLTLIHVPLLMTIFPEAKILVALRHPCDCILSGMMQNFDSNAAMMNLTSLEDGAHLYDRAFSVFEKAVEVYKPPVHMFRYEDVIGDTEGTLKAICEFLGLKWAEDMMDYRENIAQKADLIRTPSFRQVVEPINQSAKYRWLNYKKHFKDALPVLEPHLERYGYSTT